MQKNLFDFANQNQGENFNKKEENLFQNNACYVNSDNANTNLNCSRTEKKQLNSNLNNEQYCSATRPKNNSFSNTTSSLEEQARSAYEKYQNYSQEELMDEFLKTSKQKLKEGSLTSDKLQNTVNSLSPFLNNNQKEFLKGLLDKLND